MLPKNFLEDVLVSDGQYLQILEFNKGNEGNSGHIEKIKRKTSRNGIAMVVHTPSYRHDFTFFVQGDLENDCSLAESDSCSLISYAILQL